MTAAARKVLHVSQPVSEGVARWVSLLVADQCARGWDVAVACPAEGWLASEVRRLGARHIPWEATRSPGLSVLGEARRLQKIVVAERPDLVHLHSSKAGLAGRLAAKSMPAMFQPHCWSFNAVGARGARLIAAWERISARRTSAIVCVSEAERLEGLGIGVPAERMVVIRNAVDLERWTPATAQERTDARRQLGIGGDGPVAVCVGRLARQKGQDLLIEAWKTVSTEVPDARLFVVGDGPSRSELIEQAEPVSSSVTFAGASTEVPSWLAVADVVVLPSRWEGMALSVLEAGARARSVVATDVAGMAEVIGDAGGAVVAVDDERRCVGELAEAVVERLRDPLRTAKEGRLLRDRVEREFALVRALDATADLVDRLVAE
jgi:glycosyltransferase involved in cell wall biosynthesis